MPLPGGVSDPATSMEYLDAGGQETGAPARAPRRWAPIVAGAVTFVLVLVVAGALVGDWMERNLEMRALITQIEVSETAMEDTQTAITKAIDDFQAKTNPSDADRTALQDALKAAAASGHDAVASAGELVQGVRILRWHTNIEAAQRAYLAHNHAWQDYLAKASTDINEFSKPQTQVNATFAASEAPMRAAVPRPDLFRLHERVDVIYAPAPTTDSGPGQQA